ncbi:MAG: acyl-[ACP]--phospholipid O-acyltransferase, partial [Acidobacteria bacterium]
MAETLGSRFVRQAKRRWPALCIADSTGRELTFGRTLVAALLLSRAIGRLVPARAPIGLLLPASVGGALANIAATFAGAVPVNLNFTAGHDAMAAAIERCGIETILTSRAFVKKAGIETLRGMIFLEDVLARTRAPARAAMLAAARLLPAPAIERLFLAPTSPDALATIIFSSGSTGVPKGVMLTHANIVSNIDAANRVFRLQPDDVMLGVLPFFHSFGFTA